MHIVVIQRDIVEQHPFVPRSIFQAMNESKNMALRSMRSLSTYRYMLPFLTSDIDEIDLLFDDDPWPYGVESNRTALEALVSLLYEQAMISRKIAIDELFVDCNE
jgi:4,5-dihydroxyphthalate decarboxylase